MIATTVVAMAGTVLLLGVETSLRTTSESIEQTQADGLARQLMDEVLIWPYMGKIVTDPYQVPLGPGSGEIGTGRELFNDTDDFNGFTAQPAEDTHGTELGQGDWIGNLRHPNFQLASDQMDRWKQTIEVYYVDESDPSIRLTGSNTSNLRCVEVRIDYQKTDGTLRNLTTLKRTYAYLPPPP